MNAWRQALAYVGRRYYRFMVKAMAQWLKRDPTAVSPMLRRMQGVEEQRPEVQQILVVLQQKENSK